MNIGKFITSKHNLHKNETVMTKKLIINFYFVTIFIEKDNVNEVARFSIICNNKKKSKRFLT